MTDASAPGDCQAALEKVFDDILKGEQYRKAEAAMNFGELNEFLAKTLIGAAQDIRYHADTGRLEIAFAAPRAASRD